MGWLTVGWGHKGSQNQEQPHPPASHSVITQAPQVACACSLLDPAHTLHLEGVSMGAPLSEVLIVTRVVITLQYVLKTSVARKLGTNPPGK